MLSNNHNSDSSSSNDTSITAGTSVPYMLFLHREELRRRNARILKLSKTKLKLTEELVSQSVDNMAFFSVDELKNLNREVRFSHKLKCRMLLIKKLQNSLVFWDNGLEKEIKNIS